jgi:hypothetical protein
MNLPPAYMNTPDLYMNGVKSRWRGLGGLGGFEDLKI